MKNKFFGLFLLLAVALVPKVLADIRAMSDCNTDWTSGNAGISPTARDVCFDINGNSWSSYDGSAWRTVGPFLTFQGYGAVGDMEENADGITTAASTTFSSSARSCVSTDAGKGIEIADAMDSTITIADGATVYEWIQSPANSSEYYARLVSSGADSLLPEPEEVVINGSPASEGTVGSLSGGEWGYGDNDSLGDYTVYVNIGSDPDSQASGYIVWNSLDALKTTVSSCDGNDYVLADAPDNSGTSLNWMIYTDDQSKLESAMNALESGGTLVVDGKFVFDDDLVADSTAGKDMTIMCTAGSGFYRSSSCDGGSDCTNEGATANVILISDGGTAKVENCIFDGNNNYEPNNTTYRGQNVIRGREIHWIRNQCINGNICFKSRGNVGETYVPERVVWFQNRVENCWEVGLDGRSNVFGSTTTPAEIRMESNFVECSTVHPNRAAINLQGTNPAQLEVDPDASSLFYIDNYTVLNNTFICGGNEDSGPTCFDTISAGTGQYFVRYTNVEGNLIRCAPSGSHDIPLCARMLRTVVTDRDTAGDEIAVLRITNNIIDVRASALGSSVAYIIAQGTEADVDLSNLRIVLNMENNIVMSAGGGANTRCAIVRFDFDVVNLLGGACLKGVASGATTYAGVIKFENSVDHLNVPSLPAGGWSADNTLEAPLEFTDGETYGLQPGQWIYFARTDVDDGDRLQLFSFATQLCIDMTLNYEAMVKDFGRFCTANDGSTSYATVMPKYHLTRASHDVELQVLENDGSNNTKFALWQRDGGGGTNDLIVGFQIQAVRELANESVVMTYNTTDDGAQSFATTPLVRSRDQVSWRFEVQATEFTAAATSEAMTVLTVPSNWAVRDVYINHVTNFVSGGTCVVTDTTVVTGDSDDPDGYLLSFQPDVSAARLIGDSNTEVGVYNPQNASPDALVVWGSYVPDQSAVQVTLDCGGNNLGDGATSNLTSGQFDFHARLVPLN